MTHANGGMHARKHARVRANGVDHRDAAAERREPMELMRHGRSGMTANLIREADNAGRQLGEATTLDHRRYLVENLDFGDEDNLALRVVLQRLRIYVAVRTCWGGGTSIYSHSCACWASYMGTTTALSPKAAYAPIAHSSLLLLMIDTCSSVRNLPSASS